MAENDFNSFDVQTFSERNVENDSNQTNSVRNQLLIWDLLLEARIKMQKLLVNSNKLPQFDLWSTFNENCDFRNNADKTTNELCNLLGSLMELLEVIIPRNECVESSHMEEEVESDCNEDFESCALVEDTDIPKKKLKYSESESRACTYYNRVKSIRSKILDEWYEKTRYATASRVSKSMEAFEQSTVKTIEQILSNRKRLIKRTQLRRSVYEVVGKESKNSEKNEIVENDDNYDCEIFDDDDFYHQLLRELIDSKTAKIVDPISLSRKWIQIQRMRSKLKRKVDTKASKGRKIRFEVHSKLLNFMAPCDERKYSDEAKTELFASLFGNRKYLC
ncbi:protein AATF-like protein [Leptotrombidium deliense]|uniref:Protein AATF-like protein n=1 Tax=Leptotrombidium deliense TaxID=299467 RepID=A0A443SJ80_9ACAR|nr:protein AATF-like protein [Leptotrombidium deliense]